MMFAGLARMPSASAPSAVERAMAFKCATVASAISCARSAMKLPSVSM